MEVVIHRRRVETRPVFYCQHGESHELNTNPITDIVMLDLRV